MKYNKVFILGLAKSGYEAAKLLIKRGKKVLINDLKEKIEDKEKIDELKNLGVEFFFGSHPDELLDNTYDCLIKNPGIAIDHKYVIKAHELNIPVINEVELAYEFIKEKKVNIIAITGTNGKTTTTTLIYNMLKENNSPVHLAGNIGFPLCSIVDEVKDNDIIVIEVSCQQLENMNKFNPNVAVITNISEAHLEFMKTFEHYLEIKQRLLKNQSINDIAILNKGDKQLIKFSNSINSTINFFSKEEPATCYLNNDFIIYNNEKIININNIKLRGIHNYENIMAAIIAVKKYNCSNESIIKVLTTFTGVEHRLEFVANKNGRLYYNDTEATNTKCTQIALASFHEPTIIILGGYERNQNFDDLKNYISNVKTIIGIGQCRERVLKFGQNQNINTYIFETLKEGFNKCVEESKDGDVILLSPASASWDQYNRCEERGDEFKNLVNEIK